MKTVRIRSLHIFMKSARIRIFGIIFCLGSLPMRFCRAPTAFNVICKASQGCPLVLTHYFETASVAARKNLGTGTIPNIPITSLSMSFQINSSSRYTRLSDLIPRGKYRTPSYCVHRVLTRQTRCRGYHPTHHRRLTQPRSATRENVSRGRSQGTPSREVCL